MKEDKPGFVYILTNPSFKEDWVKIGKSGRPVDVRSKELDNTAVPLPFEIYATIQTIKYNEVERLVHKTIDRLTDLRIRQNREFFNVRPDVALDILRDIASTLDDAVIDTYNHGGVIHIKKNDADQEGEKGNETKALRDAFWRGFIGAMKTNPAFKEHFSVHEGLPHYAYDMYIGTTGGHVYGIASKKKIMVGLYIRRKDVFEELSKYRGEIEKVIGEEANWSEFEKNCSITISREFTLGDESRYPEVYSFLCDYAIRFKKAFVRGLELASGQAQPTEDEQQDGDLQEGRKRRSRKPDFLFSMVGIKIGETLTFTPTGLQVRVASDNQIEYQGRLYKLSPFVGTFLPEDKRTPSGAYQGAKYFSYKGKLLNEMRDEMETK